LDRNTETDTDTQTQTQTDRQTDRQTDTHKHESELSYGTHMYVMRILHTEMTGSFCTNTHTHTHTHTHTRVCDVDITHLNEAFMSHTRMSRFCHTLE